jgi:predicted enzyme related to lactoylglutathione lyase
VFGGTRGVADRQRLTLPDGQPSMSTLESPMAQSAKPRAIGLNHIALEVGDIEEALAFYGSLFAFTLRGKNDRMAFIDLGDQFIALQKGRKQSADDGRHFGLVVDDKEAARLALQSAGVTPIDGPFLDFRDPWGNRIELVDYASVQFTKAPNVLRGMGLDQLTKSDSAKQQLTDKGMGGTDPFAAVKD